MRQILVIQLGSGVDLRGGSVTKAAVRAVRDAVGCNLLPSLSELTQGRIDDVLVNVKLAEPFPDRPIDFASICKVLPIGTVNVDVVAGGMATPNGLGDTAVVVNAAVEVGI